MPMKNIIEDTKSMFQLIEWGKACGDATHRQAPNFVIAQSVIVQMFTRS